LKIRGLQGTVSSSFVSATSPPMPSLKPYTSQGNRVQNESLLPNNDDNYIRESKSIWSVGFIFIRYSHFQFTC